MTRILILSVSDMPLDDVKEFLVHLHGSDCAVDVAQDDAFFEPLKNPQQALADYDYMIMAGIDGERSPYRRLLTKDIGGQTNGDILNNYILAGGKVLAVCAAAYALSDKTIYNFASENRTATKQSNVVVFNGAAQGPIPQDYSVVAKHFETMANVSSYVRTLTMKLSDSDEVYSIPYQNGPRFMLPEDDTTTEILATYDDCGYSDPSVIRVAHGAGQVVLTGALFYIFHPQEDISRQADFARTVLKSILPEPSSHFQNTHAPQLAAQ